LPFIGYALPVDRWESHTFLALHGLVCFRDEESG
jgi:hypothetical protein